MLAWLLIACTTTEPDTGAPVDPGGDGGGGATTSDGRDQIDPSTLPAGTNPCRDPVLVTVSEVIDGDTAWVHTTSSSEKVRFIGINAPEISHDGEPAECYAQEAWDFAVEHLEGRRAWLTFDETCEDWYGRTLAYVITGTSDQDFFERAALRGGYARAYPFDDTPTFIELFDEDEAWARDHDAGGWAACGW